MPDTAELTRTLYCLLCLLFHKEKEARRSVLILKNMGLLGRRERFKGPLTCGGDEITCGVGHLHRFSMLAH